MAKPKREDYIFYQGKKFQVELYFTEMGKIIITNAYTKKSQKVSKKDLEKAKMIKKNYIARVKGGVYYEKS